jgi:hypothetical protein
MSVHAMSSKDAFSVNAAAVVRDYSVKPRLGKLEI